AHGTEGWQTPLPPRNLPLQRPTLQKRRLPLLLWRRGLGRGGRLLARLRFARGRPFSRNFPVHYHTQSDFPFRSFTVLVRPKILLALTASIVSLFTLRAADPPAAKTNSASSRYEFHQAHDRDGIGKF